MCVSVCECVYVCMYVIYNLIGYQHIFGFVSESYFEMQLLDNSHFSLYLFSSILNLQILLNTQNIFFDNYY